MLRREQKDHFDTQGYLIARGLFSIDEVKAYIDHYMRRRLEGSKPGDFSGVDINNSDPLKKFPRMIHMHRWDSITLNWMLDQRIATALSGLLEIEPFAVQSMIYYKPPMARGQALHQDQYYLRVQPGTCIAAWLALDPCDEANGCLQVVPGSHRWPLLCTAKADTTLSFTDVTVPIPEGALVLPMVMQPGDVLFFNGQVVHGSGPNRTTDRFRRSLIGHYIAGDAQQVAQFYHPVLRMDGSTVELEPSQGGGACGVWVERDGIPVIELVGAQGLAGRTE
jgi:phytanoyl-CoA hydroxylase